MASDGCGLPLLDGESVLMDIRPHILAFYDMLLVWVWVILLSLAFTFWGEELGRPFSGTASSVLEAVGGWASSGSGSLIGMLPLASEALRALEGASGSASRTAAAAGSGAAWLGAILFSSVVVSVLRIEWKWIALMVGVGVMSLALSSYLGLGLAATYDFAIMSSLVAIVFVDLYRRSHRFIVTDRRIVTEVRWGGMRCNELSFDKINNIVLEQGLMGSIFDFGTVIPVTASGLGMGSDFSSVTVGSRGSVGGIPLSAQVSGGRSVQTPRTRSMYALWGVPEPEKVKEALSRQMHAYVQAPYLRRMTEQLEDIRKK